MPSSKNLRNQLTGSPAGVKVDKSRATRYIPMRETAFPEKSNNSKGKLVANRAHILEKGITIVSQLLLEHPTGSKWYGTYSIPKGHIEEGEDRLTAAIRETKEEVGLEFNIDEIKLKDEGYINYIDENIIYFI